MAKVVKVIIDPRSNILYGSYYVQAFRQAFGRLAVCFDAEPFKCLPEIGYNFRFIIQEECIVTKVFLSTDDPYLINQDMYRWCDVYGSVNANFRHCPQSEYPKLVSLAPSFGLKCFSLFETFIFSLSNLSKCWRSVIVRETYNKFTGGYEVNKVKNIKRFLFDYYKCYFRRPSVCEYEHVNSEHDYIFFLSTLWYNNKYNNNDTGVNLRRARFIRACKSLSCVKFEGGLIGDESSSRDLFRDVLVTNTIPMKVWMEKTKKSSIVFNTPAFWDCHGWKLGEYLAMGKCIISTALSNDLPAPLIHGENIHFVDGSEESIKSAIEYIFSHEDYRLKLERGARAYWEEYGSLNAVIKLIFSCK